MTVDAEADKAAQYTWAENKANPWAARVQSRTGTLSVETADSVCYLAQQILGNITVLADGEDIVRLSHTAQTKIELATTAETQASITFVSASPPAYWQLMKLLVRHSSQQPANKNAHLK